MKTYPFIVINKNNMKTLKNFKKIEDVVDYVSDGKIQDFIIIKNESSIVNTYTVNDDNNLIRRSQLRKTLL